MSLVDKRYAQALVDISVQKNKVQAFHEELKNIVNIYNSQLDLKLLFLNPQVKSEVKKEIAEKVFGNQIEADVLNFIKLLIDKGRIKFLPSIAEEFSRLAEKYGNILNMTIIATSPLEEVQLSSLIEKYRTLYKASSVNARIEIDSTLIGGLKVKIGDKVIDGSVKGRLESLRQVLNA